ncbi:MAG TPA: penicillin-binding protein 2 [Chloroflexota bacterium]|nr:penicillin-binding protein 2 [Chloroflexota bacterium]
MLNTRAAAPSRARPVAPRRTRPAAATATTRPFIVLALMLACAAGLAARLVFWQVLQHPHLSALAAAQHADLTVQAPMRGQIFDAQGNLLATDVTEYLVYAAPWQVKDAYRTASLMAPVLHEDQRQVYQLLTQNDSITLLAPPLNAQSGQQVRNLALPGIILEPVIRRDYPEGSTAAQLLGYADIHLHGQYGLEASYDRLLSGTAGLRSVLKDTAGNTIHVGSLGDTPAQNGADLHLTLDGTVQGLVEDELHKAVLQHHADGGTIIVMDPRTGSVLGMASEPAFNPNRYWKYPYGNLVNPATQWIYEPGSTMKVLTMAAGLDSHVITPQSALDDTGAFRIADVTIRNWCLCAFGMETMTQVLQHSANVGASWVAQRLGVQRFYHYMRLFHVGQPTGIDLPNESPGLLPLPGDKSWSIVNLYTNSFGQGVAITPMRLITSIGAIANHGVMMKPQIVHQIVYGGRIITRRPVIAGRVVSAATAHTLTNMLVHSAVDGEAQMALVPGYNIAAKTGTSNVPDGHGGYLKNVTIGSTVAYAPAFHPRFIALVIINHPRDTIWGSMSAAPVIHNLFQELFMYYHIAPNPNALHQ